MTEDFAAAYSATDYRVRLSRGGYASIRIGAPLPAALRELVGTRPWGFITAWNPHGRQQDRHANRIAQRQLVDSLKALSATVSILPALGVDDAWQEPSLFVIGPDAASLDALAVLHQQLAWVHGDDSGLARLRWTHG
jgi:hypothetical protein